MAHSIWVFNALYSGEGLEIISGPEVFRCCLKPDERGEMGIYVNGILTPGSEHEVVGECGCITVHADGWLAKEHRADAFIAISRDGSLNVSPKLPADGNVGEVLEESLIIQPPAAPEPPVPEPPVPE